MATLVPSGTFWIAIATITNSPRPAVSEAKAVPIASPSGRLWTESTPKVRIAVRRSAPWRPAT
jgi:hypothetical protein